MNEWQPISTAPKNRDIVVWCENKCSHDGCAYGNPESKKLCLYHAHAEGLSYCEEGLQAVCWGGAFEDSWEDGGGYLPDWWFVKGSGFEVAANPTYWLPTEPPK